MSGGETLKGSAVYPSYHCTHPGLVPSTPHTSQTIKECYTLVRNNDNLSPLVFRAKKTGTHIPICFHALLEGMWT